MKIKEWLWNRMRCRCRYRLLICAFQENRLSKLEPYYTNTNALDWKLWKVTTHFDIESTARKWSKVFWVGWMKVTRAKCINIEWKGIEKNTSYALQDIHASHLFARVYVWNREFCMKHTRTHAHSLIYIIYHTAACLIKDL